MHSQPNTTRADDGNRYSAPLSLSATAELYADEFERAFLHGKPALLTTYRNVKGRAEHTGAPLSELVSDELTDLPDNALHDVIAYIGKRAKDGDDEALAIVRRMARDYAVRTAEALGGDE